MSSKLEYRGLSFTVHTEHDGDAGPPWERCDGHGVVTDWISSNNRESFPNQYDNREKFRPLAEDRSSTRYYDWTESLQIATRDKWGLGDKELQQLRLAELARTGQEPSAKAITERAVQLDYEYLRAWCRDDWSYIGVIVTLKGTQISRSLWGVESSDDQYIAEVARELADQIIDEGDTEIQLQIAQLTDVAKLLKAQKAVSKC